MRGKRFLFPSNSSGVSSFPEAGRFEVRAFFPNPSQTHSQEGAQGIPIQPPQIFLLLIFLPLFTVLYTPILVLLSAI